VARVRIGGRELGVEDTGGDGPPVVLSHDFLMDQRMFSAQVRQLADVYRVITWDQRGFGDTPADGQPFTLWDSADDLFGLLDHLGIERAVLVGSGQGSEVALRAALAHPDRVRALVLVDAQAGAEPPEAAEAYRSTLDRWIAHGYRDEVADAVAARVLGDSIGASQWRGTWQDVDPAQLQAATEALLDRDDLSDRVEELAMPVLLVHGTAGLPATISRAHEICEAASDCRGVVEVPGAAHASILTHPEIVTPALRDFLEGLPA
jgi:3-oxoadipate enol-lactonase